MALIPAMGARLGLGLVTRPAAFLRGAAALVAGALRLREPVGSSSDSSSSLSSSTGEAARPRAFLAAGFLTGTALDLDLVAEPEMERSGMMEAREERRGVPLTEGAGAAEADDERAPVECDQRVSELAVQQRGNGRVELRR